MTYLEMYQEAANQIDNGSYKGYVRGNALSLYVYDKYGVNAADDPSAHDALLYALNN
jgi:hypothetical protein